jgi:hypothetical protein
VLNFKALKEAVGINIVPARSVSAVSTMALMFFLAGLTVSRAMLPEEKSKPKRALIGILGTLLGGMLSVLIVLIRHYSRKS